MFQTHMVSNLWDLVDLGLEDGLDRIHATGVTGATVVVTSGPVAYLRGPAASSPRIFRSRGGFFFQPELDRYRDTRVKPVTASWLKSRNPLDDVAAGCRERNLDLRLRISAFQVGRIAERYPETAGQSAFGDAAIHALCPAHADVRALLRAVVDDLAGRYAPSAIEIDDLVYHSGAGADLLAGGAAALHPDLAPLLGVCFSESSRQWAVERGVAAGAAQRWVCDRVDGALAGSGPDDLAGADVLARESPLRPYIECQVAALDGLLASMAQKGAVGIVPRVAGERGVGVVPSAAGVRAGSAAVVVVAANVGEDFASFARRTGEFLGPGFPWTVEMELGGAWGPRPDRVIGAIKQAVDRGLAGASFGHFGQLVEPAFETARQAVRYARRSAP